MLCLCLLSSLGVLVIEPGHWNLGIAAQVKTGALTLLSTLTRVASEEMARSLPDTVPALTAAMADAKRQVQVRRAGCPARQGFRVFAPRSKF